MSKADQQTGLISFAKIFKEQLYSELKVRKMIPSIEDYKITRSYIAQKGEEEYENLKSLIGKSDIDLMINSLKYIFPSDTCIRILGFGHVLTEFLISPLDLPNNIERKIVVQFGSLANLIVSIYDHLLDVQMKKSRTILPRWILKAVFKGRCLNLMKIITSFKSDASKIIIRLLIPYSKFLLLFPHSDKILTVKTDIKKSIFKLYEVGIDVTEKDCGDAEKLLKLKRALPFVIMGLPGWILKDTFSKETYQWHKNWMYQFGEFISWIDDSVDLVRDKVTNHPNRVLAIWEKSGADPTISRILIQNITDQAKIIMKQWQEKTSKIENLPLHVTEAFSTCIISWLGISLFKLKL
jgi:hypothetical protein